LLEGGALGSRDVTQYAHDEVRLAVDVGLVLGKPTSKLELQVSVGSGEFRMAAKRVAKRDGIDVMS
jgi:hypothetical protein